MQRSCAVDPIRIILLKNQRTNQSACTMNALRRSRIFLLYLHAILIGLSDAKIPTTSMGIKIRGIGEKSSSRRSLRKSDVRGARGGASAVAAAGATKTMSASTYKVLK